MFKQQSQLRQTVQHLRDVDAMSCGQREELEQVVARIREALRLRYAAPPGAVLDDIETIVGDHATP
jgi:signal transduction histidine kinase